MFHNSEEAFTTGDTGAHRGHPRVTGTGCVTESSANLRVLRVKMFWEPSILAEPHLRRRRLLVRGFVS